MKNTPENIANNPNTHWTTLDELSTNSDATVRNAIVENANASILTLERMAVRETDEAILVKLLSHTNSFVRHAAMCNPNIDEMPLALSVIKQIGDNNADIMTFCDVTNDELYAILADTRTER